MSSIPSKTKNKPPKPPIRMGYRIVAGPNDSFPVVCDSRTGYVNPDLMQECGRSAVRAGVIAVVPVAEGGAL